MSSRSSLNAEGLLSFFKSNKALVIGGTALLAVPAAAAVFRIVRGSQPAAKGKGKSGKRVHVDPRAVLPESVECWSPEDVLHWLETCHVSAEAVQAFREGEVDGRVLLLLQDTHLRDMGVTKIGDRLKVAAEIAKLTQPAHQTPREVVEPRPQRSQPTGRVEPKASANVPPPAAPAAGVMPEPSEEVDPEAIEREETRQRVAMLVIEKLRELYGLLNSEEFLSSAVDDQLAMLDIADQEVDSLIALERELDEEQRAHVAPATASLKAVIGKTQAALNQHLQEAKASKTASQSASTNEAQRQSGKKQEAKAVEAAAEAPPPWAGIADQVADSLRELRTLVQSQAAADSPNRVEVGRSVLVQVNKIRNFVRNSLPAEVQADLLLAMNILEKETNENLLTPAATATSTAATQSAAAKSPSKASRKQSTSDSASEASLDSPPKSRASTQYIAQRLSAIASSLQGSFEELKPEDQKKFIEVSLRDVAGLKKEAKHLPDEQREVVLEMAETINELLTQTNILIDGRLEEAAAQRRTTGSQNAVASKVVEALQRITQVIKSEEFAAASPDKKRRVAEQFDKDLTGMEEIVLKLPEADRARLAPVYLKVRDFVQRVKNMPFAPLTKKPREPSQVEEIDEEAEAENEDGSADDYKAQREEKPAEAVKEEDEPKELPQMTFSEAISRLKAMYGVLGSESFKAHSTVFHKQVASAMLKDLESYKQQMTALSEAEKEALKELVDSLESILRALVSLSADQSEGNAQEGGGEEEEAEEEDVDPEMLPDEKPAATGDEGIAETPSLEDRKMFSIVNTVQGFMSILNSEGFMDLDDERRATLATKMLSQVASLEASIDELGEMHKGSLKPVLLNLRRTLQWLADPERKPGQDEAADEGSTNTEEQPQPTAAGISPTAVAAQATVDADQLYQLAAQSTRMLQQGKPLTLAQLTSMMQVLELMDTLPTDGVSIEVLRRRMDIRKEFQSALGEMINGVTDGSVTLAENVEGGDEEDDAEADPETQSATTQLNRDLVEADDETLLARTPDRFKKLVTTLISIRQDIGNGVFQVPEQITPYVTVLDDVLQAATREGLPWRQDPVSVYLVKAILDEVGRLQKEIGEGKVSILENIRGAIEILKNNPIESIESLQPYVELLAGVSEMQEQLSIDDLRALQQLQDLVIAATDKLTAQDGSALLDDEEEDRPLPDEKGSKVTEGEASQDEEGIPPLVDPSPVLPPHRGSDFTSSEKLPSPEANATASRSDAEGQRKPTPPSSTTTSPSKAERQERAEQQVKSQLRQLAVKIAETKIQQAMDLAPFLVLLEKVRAEQGASDDIIRSANHVFGLLEAKLAEIGKTVADVHAEVMESKRQSLKKLTSVIGHTLFASMAPEQQSNAVERVERLIESLTPEEAAALKSEVAEAMIAIEQVQPQSVELVPGSPWNEFTVLVPRILERLTEPDFVQNTSTFEIDAIAHLLERLSQNKEFKANADSAQIIEVAKQKFERALSGYDGSGAKDESEVQCKLNLLSMRSESEDGVKVQSYLLVGPEEEEYHIDEATARQFNHDPRPTRSLTSEEHSVWEGSSEALLVCIPHTNEDGAENRTALSELNSLAYLLTDRQYFNVNAVPNAMSSESVVAAIQGILARNPSRFLLYILTSPDRSKLPHEVVFPDGSFLTLRSLQNLFASKTECSLIVMDSGHALEVASTDGEEKSSFALVSVTDGAFSISNCSRCWLYDGLFTPIILDLLSKSELPVLCAEDLINFTVRLLICSENDSYGSYLGDRCLAAPFFNEHES